MHLDLSHIAKAWLLLIYCSFIANTIHGQNPISPEGYFIADPSAHVWKDGKIYLYGSVDKKPTDFC